MIEENRMLVETIIREHLSQDVDQDNAIQLASAEIAKLLPDVPVEWAQHVISDLIPKIASSALCLHLVPTGPTDVKFAVELGFSVMLDKPMIGLIAPGSKVPEKLARVVDRFVEFDTENMESSQQRLQVEIEAFIRERESNELDS